MLNSMTGYASGQGAGHGYSWSWDVRSVNGKGLDIRLRAPDWIDGLEHALRKMLGTAAKRGNVTCNLRVQRDDVDSGSRLNLAHLETILTAMGQIETHADKAGVSLAPSNAADIVAMRGMFDAQSETADVSELRLALEADLAPVLVAFCAMRADEGRALADILNAQLDEVDSLTQAAKNLLSSRHKQMAQHFKRNLMRVMERVETDPDRVAQELAALAVKTDITEELDRLEAHIKAARTLVAQGNGVGRKLDFLMQEFNREANTLCSKAQMRELTDIGLALKVVIDQMREQVQNVE